MTLLHYKVLKKIGHGGIGEGDTPWVALVWPVAIPMFLSSPVALSSVITYERILREIMP